MKDPSEVDVANDNELRISVKAAMVELFAKYGIDRRKDEIADRIGVFVNLQTEELSRDLAHNQLLDLERRRLQIVERLEQTIARAAARRIRHRYRMSRLPFCPWMILAAVAKPEHREAVLGDLLEQFQRNAERHGVEAARRIVWTDAIVSIGPFLWSAVKRIGFVAALIEGARRLFS